MRKSRDSQMDRLILAYSFVIPCLAVLLGFAIKGIAPFGGRTLCSMDGFSQYYPMLQNMGEAVKNGEVFYSFSGALGFNLWAQNAYYTNSPLWLIVYLLPHEMQITGIHFLILLKIGLAGFLFCYRLLRVYDSTDYKKIMFLYPALSVAWALSGYMIAFINQFMWTDVIVLLPAVVLGIEELVRGRKPFLYIGALFLSIWSCYYLSFMVCIFSVFYFFFLLFKREMQAKARLQHCLLFGISSLTSGMMAGVVLLPTAKALSLTLAGDAVFNKGIEINYTLGEFLLRFLPFQKVSLEYGEPNLYCGVVAVALMIVYLIAGKASKREKLLSFAFVTFMFLTMSVNIGEFVWHGFHFPNQLPARQSFLAIFLVLSLAGEGVDKSEFKKGAEIILSALLVFGVSASFIYQLTNQTWASRVDSLQRYEKNMAEFTAMNDGELFVRREWVKEKKNNYPQQYRYNGIGYYSSTMTGSAYEFFQALGMERYAKNVSTYYNQSEILNSLFGVKYILEEDGKAITVNENALPLAFLSDEEVLNLNLADYNGGEEVQKALWDSVIIGGDEFNAQVKELQANGVKLTYFDTDVIKGEISCERDGLLLTTLPYDGGWRIYIDGEQVPTKEAAGYLTSAMIRQGEHEVEFRYTVPGIKAGAAVSICGMLGLAIIITWYKRRKSARFARNAECRGQNAELRGKEC